MQKYSDEELVAMYKESRDHQYLTELFTRHSGLLYRSAFRTMKNPSDAEDILQTAYIKMISDLPNYKGTGSVIGWMLQVVIHTCYERFRSEKSRLIRERKVMSERNQTTKPNNYELKEMIEAHLNKLPEIYKAPITLKIMEGLSIKEVSDALEIPEKTIRSQIERGLEKLKASLQSVGVTASVVSIGEMLFDIQKPMTPEIFTSNQYFNSLYLKKAAISAKIAAASGSKSKLFHYLFTFSALLTVAISVFIGWNYFSKAPVLNTKIPMQQKWNFENTQSISEYSSLGLLNGAISIVNSIGVNNSNVLKIEKDSIIEIDIAKYKLPIKISYLTDTKTNAPKSAQTVGFMQMVYKSNYRSDQKILKVSGIRENIATFELSRGTNSKLDYFGKWFSFMGYIDEDSICFYMDGQRSYYLKGASYDNKKIYLSVKADTIIDDLVIESLDKSDLPDKSDFEKVCASVKFSKDVEYYEIEKEKLKIPNSSTLKPYLRIIRPDFFSHIMGTDNKTIYPSLSATNKVGWINNNKRFSKTWDFETVQDLEDFKLIKGSFFDGKSLGLNQSNCLGLEANSVMEVDISKFKLPLKITYSADFMIPGDAAGNKSSNGFAVLKGNYQKNRNILDFVNFRPTKVLNRPNKNKNENTKLGFVGEWVVNTIYVSDDCLDFYVNGNRTSIKFGKSNDSKILYFVLMDKFLIDYFMIESIEPDTVPDMSKFKKFSETFPFEKGSRGYFEVEKGISPLYLEKDSLVKLAVFDSETIEFNLGLTK